MNTLKVYNKTYISVPSDTVVVNNINNSVSYRDQVWVGLGMLCIFMIIWFFKKPKSFTLKEYPHIKDIYDNQMLPTKVINRSEVKGKSKDIIYFDDAQQIPPKLDMSQLGEINIKNQKL